MGDGLLKKEMQQKAKDLNLHDRIKFVGFIPHPNVIKYFNDLSVFVAVSERESFGVSVLEAAACKVPSITSNIGGLPEVNIDNETGIIINPNDSKKLAESIVILYDNDRLRARLAENARKRVSRLFNWKNDLNNMIKIYEQF